jgi:hypothetical protein
MDDSVDDETGNEGAVRIVADDRFFHNLFDDDDDVPRSESYFFLHPQQAP